MAYEPCPLAPHLEAFTDVCIAVYTHADPEIIEVLKARVAREEAALERLDGMMPEEVVH